MENHLKKYRHAACGFFALNVVYIALIFTFPPPLSREALSAFSLLGLVLMGVLSCFIYKGSRKLAKALAVIYGLRSVLLIYSLIAGKTFIPVPYIFPCLVLTFYLLGRAAWGWP